ncbi:hypothetical protein PTKIN_Ptkin16aG0094000 [Pterospermum kingtungense]
MSVLIVTSLGDIVVDLYTDKCPLTCKTFLKLLFKIKYYNGCLFHTVQKDFTAQTGDQLGPGQVETPFTSSWLGRILMLPRSISHFGDGLQYPDGKHTVFGEVAERFETLNKINEAYVDEKNRPYENIRIKHTYRLEDPFDDPSQLSELIPDASPRGKPNDMSLCYAFIEFETNEACEQAYFKMDNALIDDTRIHVDFSQSVAKLWFQYRRKDHITDVSRYGGRRDDKHLKDQIYGERHIGRQRGRDDADHKRRYPDNDSPPSRGQDDHRKRSCDGDSCADKKNGRDYRKRHAIATNEIQGMSQVTEKMAQVTTATKIGGKNEQTGTGEEMVMMIMIEIEDTDEVIGRDRMIHDIP